MKKKLTIVILFLLINQISNGQTGWFIQPSFTSQNLYDCKQSAVYGLYLATDFGTILRSSNNGLNWAVYNFAYPLPSNPSPFKYILGQSNDNWTAVGGQSMFGYHYQTSDSIMRIPGLSQINLEAISIISGYFFYSATVAAGAGGKFLYQGCI